VGNGQNPPGRIPPDKSLPGRIPLLKDTGRTKSPTRYSIRPTVIMKSFLTDSVPWDFARGDYVRGILSRGGLCPGFLEDDLRRC